MSSQEGSREQTDTLDITIGGLLCLRHYPCQKVRLFYPTVWQSDVRGILLVLGSIPHGAGKRM